MVRLFLFLATSGIYNTALYAFLDNHGVDPFTGTGASVVGTILLASVFFPVEDFE
jgi:hypothetical protein